MSDMNLNTGDRISLASSSRVTSIYRDTGRIGPVASNPEVAGDMSAQDVAAAAPDREKVQEAVSRINEYVQQSERTLDFKMDEDSGQIIVRVYDKQSDELIRQIPSELALELAQKLNDEEPALLFSAQV